jgi:hypothetical protein
MQRTSAKGATHSSLACRAKHPPSPQHSGLKSRTKSEREAKATSCRRCWGPEAKELFGEADALEEVGEAGIVVQEVE